MTEHDKERRYWIWLGLLLALLVAGGVMFYLWDRRGGGRVEDPYRAVPVDAFLVMESNDLPDAMEKLGKENLVWKDLSRIPEAGQVRKAFLLADSLFGSDMALYRLFRGGPLLVSFHDLGKKDAGWLVLVRLPAGMGGKGVTETFSCCATTKKLREYNQVQVWQVLFKGASQPFYYAVKKGLLLLTPHRLLLEESIRQADAPGSLLDDPGFVKVRKTAGSNEMVNLFLRTDKVPVFLRGWLVPAVFTRLERLMPVGGWTELDVTVQPRSILLNGFTLTPSSGNTLLGLLADEEPQSCDILEVIPTAACAGVVVSFRDGQSFHRSVVGLQKRRGNIRRGTEVPESVVDAFAGMISRQASHVILNVRNEQEENNHFVVAAVTSGQASRRSVEELLKEYAQKKGTSYSSLLQTIAFDRETRMTVYHLPYEGLPSLLFGRIMGSHAYRYLMVSENYLLFGNSVRAVSRFFRFNILQQTLTHDPSFREFAEGLAMRSNLFAFVRISDGLPVAGRVFSEKVQERFRDYVQEPVSFRYAGYEAIAQNGMIYNNLYFLYSEKEDRPAVTVWESLLDTLFDYKPQLVLNHRTHQREIFLQDRAHRIYLINASGRVLWKLPLREPLLGQAWQIDYYRNGKLQLLFNTRHALHLIDRNGNYVERFPVTLRSPASGPMALFDYEKNRNYRIFVPGEDSRMYLYDKTGNLVPGWKITECESPVRTPVQHFVYGGKDYLVFSDTMNLYVLDRRGRVRVPVQESIIRPPHQGIFFAAPPGGGTPHFVVNSTGGEVCFVSLQGQVKRMTFAGVPDESWFLYEDLDGDGAREFIFLFDDKLLVMRRPGREAFSRRFDGQVDAYAPVVYTFSQKDRKIGVTDATHGDIYLVNNNGSLYEGFPMKGRTQFTIGRLGPARQGFNLIVGGEDNFLYNYSVK